MKLSIAIALMTQDQRRARKHIFRILRTPYGLSAKSFAKYMAKEDAMVKTIRLYPELEKKLREVPRS